MRRFLGRATLAIMAAAAFAVGPATAAVAQPQGPVVDLSSKAALQAEGAAIVLQVTLDCDPSVTASVSVAVAQRVRRDVARGFGSADVPCGRQVRIDVPTLADLRPFRTGVAFAIADVYACSPDRCSNSRDFGEIRIHS